MRQSKSLNISTQDKRLREMHASRFKKLVQKSRELKIASFGGSVIVNSKRTILDTAFYAPPGTALERCLNDPAIREPLVKALVDTMAELLNPDSPCNVKTEEDDQDSPLSLGPLQIIRKPPIPVFSMTCNEMIVYFPQFLRDLYKLEGWAMGTYRLHPKLDAAGEVIAAPDKLDIYDDIAEGILPRLKYCGSGKKFGGKDLLLKQKSVCSYIFSKLGIDHKTFALDVKDVEVVTNSELAVEAMYTYDIGNDTPRNPPPFRNTMDIIDEEMHTLEESKLVKEDAIIQASNYCINEQEVAGKTSKNKSKLKRKKKVKHESSESSESSSSDSESEEETQPTKKQKCSRRKRSSKHSTKESDIFQKTFMKMMQKTMKSVLAQQMK